MDALVTTRLVNVPVSLVIEEEVNPESSGWVWDDDANDVGSKSVISELECVCPSTETGFPSTVMPLASIVLKFNWSNDVAA